MVGIYIHIPFCKQACHYCNFHFSTNLDREEAVVQAICSEIRMRHDFLQEKKVASLYLGGGTPSILSQASLEALLKQIEKFYDVSELEEFTIEANPDDITAQSLALWHTLGINRISLGVQSFFDEDLEYMNRAHTSKQSYRSIELIKKSKIKNFSIDLIYGGHTTTAGMLLTNINEAVQLKIPHLSVYGMTVEKKTALHAFIEKGELSPLDEEKQALQFTFLMDQMEEEGYEQYEISNYCKKRKYALHNTNYWKAKPYIGFGPSAHSFNGEQRMWNISDNNAYVKAISNKSAYSETEILTKKDKYNEYLLTGLRTMWGVDMKRVETDHKSFLNVFEAGLARQLKTKMLVKEDNQITLTKEGKLVADNVIADLFET